MLLFLGVMMFSPPSKSAPATPDTNSHLWSVPECAVGIQVHYHFIDRLQKEAVDQAPTDREAGGVLIGSQLPGGEVEICDHLSLPPRWESTKNFIICSDALTAAVRRKRAPDRQVIGFYRTHVDQRLELRAEDEECMRSKFNNPTNVFLLLHPREGRGSGRFFFWQDGAVVGGPTFPFSSAELKTLTWTTSVGEAPKKKRLAILLRHARTLVLRVGAGMREGWADSRVRVGAVALVAILTVLFAAVRLYHPNAGASSTLGLQVERTLLGIEVKWNPATPEVASAKDADLVVWDGSNPPSLLRLTPEQLLAGRTYFSSVNDRVEIRLDIIGTGGRARTESIVSVAHAKDLSAPSVPATVTAQQLKEEVKASPPVVPAPVLAPPSLVTRATPPAPAPKPNNRLAELSKRPEPQSAIGEPTAVLTQRFHEFTPPVKPAPVLAEGASPVAFQAAVPIRETRPEIPSELRTQVHSDNVVDVEVRISASGKVTDAKLGALKGPLADALGKTAVNAALGWQFRPATQNGEAVPSDKILEFLFRPSTR